MKETRDSEEHKKLIMNNEAQTMRGSEKHNLMIRDKTQSRANHKIKMVSQLISIITS